MCCLIILSPWVYRNYQLFDKPVFATTSGGFDLLLGNNPLYYQQLDHTEFTYSATEFDESVRRFKSSAELNFDFGPRRASLKIRSLLGMKLSGMLLLTKLFCITFSKNPIGFAKGCLAELKAFWTPLPADVQEARSDTQYAVGIWYVLIYLLIAHFTLFHSQLGSLEPLCRSGIGRGILTSPCFLVEYAYAGPFNPYAKSGRCNLLFAARNQVLP